jgi:hypothetical protein
LGASAASSVQKSSASRSPTRGISRIAISAWETLRTSIDRRNRVYAVPSEVMRQANEHVFAAQRNIDTRG